LQIANHHINFFGTFLLGLVKTLVNQTQQKGSKKIDVVVSDLQAGIYYARLQVENNVETSKLVVIK